MTRKLFVMAAALMLAGCLTAMADGFRHPAKEIEELTLASPLPSVVFDRDYAKAVMGYRACRQVPIAELAASEARIAGVRIDPRNFSETRENYFDRLELLDVATGQTRRIEGLPADLRAKFLTWSPSGKKLAFTLSFPDHVEYPQPYGSQTCGSTPFSARLSSSSTITASSSSPSPPRIARPPRRNSRSRPSCRT